MTLADHSSENSAETETAATPGQLLAQARERAGITQQQAAQALHMTATKVRAIEADDYGRLHVDTFARGYLRAYAVFLKLDPAEVLAAYEQQTGTRGELFGGNDFVIKEKEQGRKAWRFIIALMLVLALLLLISVWFFGNRIPSPAATASLPSETATSLATATPTAQVAMPVDQPVDAENQSGAENSQPETAETITDTDELNTATALQPQAEVAAQQAPLDNLQLEFSEECWLEVSDAQGDVLATDLQRAGSRVSLQGLAPFQIKLGNAPAVKVTLNGEAIEIAPPAGNKVFTVSVGE